MLPIFFRPEQGIKKFEVLRKDVNVSDIGRVTYGEFKSLGIIQGYISSAEEKEILYYKQMGHPITHTVVVRGKSIAKAEDILTFNGDKYYIQGIEEPAGAGIFQIIYCKKR